MCAPSLVETPVAAGCRRCIPQPSSVDAPLREAPSAASDKLKLGAVYSVHRHASRYPTSANDSSDVPVRRAGREEGAVEGERAHKMTRTAQLVTALVTDLLDRYLCFDCVRGQIERSLPGDADVVAEAGAPVVDRGRRVTSGDGVVPATQAASAR